MKSKGKSPPNNKSEPVNNLDELLNFLSPSQRLHSQSVAVCSSIMAEYAKKFHWMFDYPIGIEPEIIAYLGGTCHDIGKLFLRILEEDYDKHPEVGAQILEKYKSNIFDNEEQAKTVIKIVRNHHERPDGSGFPDGLRAKDISLAAGICAVADSLDHLKKTNCNDMDILQHIRSQCGSAFCESAVICFELAWSRLIEQYEKWNETAK